MRKPRPKPPADGRKHAYSRTQNSSDFSLTEPPAAGAAQDEQLARLQQARELAAAARPDPAAAALGADLAVLREELKNYEVLERLEFGGQGVVYRARQRGTNRIVALKLLLDGPLATQRQRDRFVHEIELVSRLRHPNIVTVYESGTVRGRLYYAMEFVEGVSISDYVVLHDLAPRQIVALLLKVCNAVHHAHQNAVIHRDLKPGNIFVDEAGEPRVFDFGLAKDVRDGVEHSVADLGGGTLPYLSPEQAGFGDGQVDALTDVYALGVVLYELLADEYPYPLGAGRGEAMQAIREAEPRPLRQAVQEGGLDRMPGLREIDRDLELVVAKALAKIKSERYGSVTALADDLAAWLAGNAVAARAGSRWYAVRKTLRRHRIAASVAGVMLICLAGSSVAITRAWLTTRAERARAEAERDNARVAVAESVDQFALTLTELEESVKPLAGGIAVRDRLLQKLADRLPKLQQMVRSDATLAPVLLKLLEKQAEIAADQGQRDEAVRLYSELLPQVRAAWEAGASDENAARLLRVQRRLGFLRQDATELEAAARAGEDLYRQRDCDEVRRELAQTYLDLGIRESVDTGLEPSVARLRRVDELSQGMSGSRWDGLRATAWERQGRALHKSGHGPEAAEKLKAALTLRASMAAAAPADVDARYALATSYQALASFYSDDNDVAGARDNTVMCISQLERLIEADPTGAAWYHNLYAAEHNLAALLMKLGELDEAASYLAQARATAERWVRCDPTPAALDSEYFTYILEGRRLRALRCPAEALVEFATAHDLAGRNPNPDRVAELQSAACDELALCALKLEDHASAVVWLDIALALQEPLFAKEPLNMERALNLVQLRLSLGRELIKVDNPDDAAGLMVAAEQLLAELDARSALEGWDLPRTRLAKQFERAWAELFAAVEGAPR